jgi:GT2 family glycosyltransferase
VSESLESEAWPLVTIVISNLNGREVLRECLVSIGKLDYPNYEVIVVDAGSKDNSVEMMRKDFHWVKLIEAKGTGLAESNNIGVSNSSGSIVVVDLNNDDCVDRDWLRNLVSAFVAERSLGAVCGKRLQTANPELIDSVGGRINPLTGDAPGIGNGQASSFLVHGRLLVDYVPVILTTRKLYDLVGGCDEDYFIYFEDTDLSYQIHRLGLDVAVVPQAVFYHKGSSTVGKSSSKQYYMQRRNGMRFILKNLPMEYVLFAISYRVVFVSIIDTMVSIGLVNKLLQRVVPSHRGFFLNRGNRGLVLAQAEAILWNLRNLGATFMARAKAQYRIQNARFVLSEESNTDVDPRF